ncbi:MAG TPA: prolipoprotein diacylglyceryl transferase [Mycobacteriales bacterium]|nr:prolipoprotein diacylglyceryl transferase [Mycobacteriales bacterium]
MLPASIPSPPTGVVHLGPLPIRAYALCIILGIVVAVVVGERRLQARGAPKGAVGDIATWAVPFGLVGARLYHLATNPELYWGAHGQGTVAAFEIWHGGLGIWGAIAGGALGAWIGCRRRGVSFAMLADALAPGLALAQAIGRWGNYFNQELYGRPTDLPWAVRIDPAHRIDPAIATYHPTFLYESLWDIGVALLVIWAGRRWRLDHGRSFALYAAAYTVGRGWIEALRIDDAHRFFGLRLNDWTSIVIFAAAVAYLVLRRPGPEPAEPETTAEAAAGADEGRTLTA